nr:MAG TPA: hypothetical protein [Bacteriophage sp.]
MYYISNWNILVERTYIPSKSRFQLKNKNDTTLF